MHDTAFEIGTLALNIYANLPDASILEIGSQSVNGSLRSNALPTTNYVGVDIAAGEGVDLVIEPGQTLPVEDASFDFVIASSVFEHDPCFWMTFLEMCRATKEGGYIYINAPSNGVVHRYPMDNWRFYPDSGKALAEWAVTQGQHVTLVESFTADRTADIWNDFAAIFRKGRITKTLPEVFLHEQVACSNVRTWKSNEILNPRETPQDIIMLDVARGQAREFEQKFIETASQRDASQREVADLKSKLAQADRIRHELRVRENELTQRQEEIAQTRSELARARGDIDLVNGLLSAAEKRASEEAEARTHASDELASLTELYDRQLVTNRELSRRLQLLEEQAGSAAEEVERLRGIEEDARVKIDRLSESERLLEQKLSARFKEIARITELLAEQEAISRDAAARAEWLQKASTVLLDCSSNSVGFLEKWIPSGTRSKRRLQLLKSAGLFDGDAYLEAHPDVAADGADPLAHYLRHGMIEGRVRE